MKIWQYLRLHMKIIRWRFHIKTPFTFWDMRTWDMWKVCLQTFRNNRICWKLAYFLRNLQTSRANNSRILGTKNAKFSGYCFYMNTNIYCDFEICISAPLIVLFHLECGGNPILIIIIFGLLISNLQSDYLALFIFDMFNGLS